jgi:hypothetical protein
LSSPRRVSFAIELSFSMGSMRSLCFQADAIRLLSAFRVNF